MLDHQPRRGRGELAVDLPALLAAQVVGDADVHAARPEVAVHDAGQLVLCAGVHGSRRDSRPDRQARPRSPPIPATTRPRSQGRYESPAPSSRTRQRAARSPRSGTARPARSRPFELQPVQKTPRRGRGLVGPVSVEIHVEERLTVGQATDRVVASPQPHRVHDGLVHPFHRGRRELQDRRDVPRGVDHVGVPETHEQSRRRFRNELHPGAQHDHARALAADQRPRDVETVLRKKVAQVVARYLTGEAAELGTERGQVRPGEGSELLLDLEGTADRDVVVRVGGPQSAAISRQARTVSGHDVEFQHVVRGSPVPNRMIATGIVADSTPDRRPGSGRRIGGEGQAPRGDLLSLPGKLGQDDTGVDVGDPTRLVDRVDPVQVPREVQDDTGADRVARHRGATAPADQRRTGSPALPNDGGDLVGTSRKHDPDRRDPVVGRVVGVRRDAMTAGLHRQPGAGQPGDDVVLHQ